MKPLELKLADQRRRLIVTWENGDVSHLEASVLRRHSRSAPAVRARLDGAQHEVPDVHVSGIEPVGGYAVRLIFSDGHDRAIYPWAHLRAIANEGAETAA